MVKIYSFTDNVFFCIYNQVSPFNITSSHQTLYLVKIIMILLQCGFRFFLKKEGWVITCMLNCHFLFGKRTLDFPNAIRFALSGVIQQTIWTSTKPGYTTVYNEAKGLQCFFCLKWND